MKKKRRSSWEVWSDKVRNPRCPHCGGLGRRPKPGYEMPVCDAHQVICEDCNHSWYVGHMGPRTNHYTIRDKYGRFRKLNKKELALKKKIEKSLTTTFKRRTIEPIKIRSKGCLSFKDIGFQHYNLLERIQKRAGEGLIHDENIPKI